MYRIPQFATFEKRKVLFGGRFLKFLLKASGGLAL